MFNAIEKSELKNLIVNNDMPESLSAQEKKRLNKAREFYSTFIKRLGKPVSDFEKFMYDIKIKHFIVFMANDMQKDYTNAYDL